MILCSGEPSIITVLIFALRSFRISKAESIILDVNETGRPRFAGGKMKKGAVQLDLFSSATESVITEIMSLDLKRLKPEDALSKLIEIKKKISS